MPNLPKLPNGSSVPGQSQGVRGTQAPDPRGTPGPVGAMRAADGGRTPITIGKIVRSESHVRYTCQVFGPGETVAPPEPTDFAFGSFVRLPLRSALPVPDVARLVAAAPDSDARVAAQVDALMANERARETGQNGHGETASWAIGLIYDTILLNPDFGTLGPRLSNDEQVSLFSPDYIAERAVVVSILLLGSVSLAPSAAPRVRHGVPPIAPDLGAVVYTMSDAEVRGFHIFADAGPPGGARPYLHMGYLPHAVAQDHPLLPMAMLHTLERLERLCPENAALLAIVKRNFAWRLKVEATG